METINIKNLPISSNDNLKTVIGFNENDELIKATYSNNGGGSSEGGNDVVYFNFEIEDGEFNVNDDFGFKIVAQALKENKIVYVNGGLVTSYYIDDNLIGYISIVNNNFITIYDARFTNFLQNTVEVTSQWFTIPDEENLNWINDEVSSLNDRVTELENNGGGSSGGGKESVVIDLGVTTEPNLTKEQIIEIADNFLSKKYTIKYIDTNESNTDYQLRLIDIIAVNDTRGGDDPAKYVELVGVTININIELLKWKFQQGYLTTPDSITLEKESLSKIVWEYLVPLMSNVSNLETKVTNLENKVQELENKTN